MELIEPSLAYAQSFTEAIREFGDTHIPGVMDEVLVRKDIPSYIQKMQHFARGENLPEGFVPASTFWLVDDAVFIGHVNIRHRLSESLRIIGGHIGYAVRPSMRAKGFGSTLLALAIPKMRELGIEKALITCDKDNIASRKVIEKNGGTLQQEISVNGKPVLHFYIDLI